MKTMWKIGVGGAAASLVAFGGCFAWLESASSRAFLDAPLPAVQASADAEVVARGEYLVHHVAHCSACHLPHDEAVAAARAGEKRPLKGGGTWDIPGFGLFVAPNLTPDEETGLGAWSDAEVARAVRYGVGRDGRVLPMMRIGVGPLSDDDLVAVVSYLRSVAPVRNALPRDVYGPIGKLVATRMQPSTEEAPPYAPPGAISVERGRYLALGPAACARCHTARDPMAGFALVAAPMSGGGEPDPDPKNPDVEIVAPNLTPDERTGHVAAWSEDAFLQRFRAGVVHEGSQMPWAMYAGLSDEDVRSLWRFLRTLPPVENDVGPTVRAAGWQPGDPR